MNPAYNETVFEFIPNKKTPNFWVITAYNPDGKPADAGDNIAGDAELRAEIGALGITPFRIIGLSPDEKHAEPGWGIPCDEATAIRLGRQFRQDAVFHFTAGEIWLIGCLHSVRQTLANPAGRIRDPRDTRHFSLFVGSPPDSETIDGETLAGIRSCIEARFGGFTLQKAEGSFRSRIEETVVIHIATREPREVIELARDLRLLLNQEGIGLSHNGIYQRVREWSDDDLILATLEIPPKSIAEAPSSKQP
jgi:hypothetical protein